MKEIPLTQGKVTIVDDEDYERLNQFKWYAHHDGNTFYAKRNLPESEALPRTGVLIHRVILNVPNGFETDHIDGNGLNNLRSNLRIVTKRGNCQNRHHGKKTSRLPGVSYRPKYKDWVSYIQVNGINKNLGKSTTEDEAHRKYEAALKRFNDGLPIITRLQEKTSKYPGVSFDASMGKWVAKITINEKQKHLGRFNSEEEANERCEISIKLIADGLPLILNRKYVKKVKP